MTLRANRFLWHSSSQYNSIKAFLSLSNSVTKTTHPQRRAFEPAPWNVHSMAVFTLRMALFPVYPAATSTAGVAFATGTPPGTSRDPADFRFAHAALEPVAAPLFHYDDLETRWLNRKRGINWEFGSGFR